MKIKIEKCSIFDILLLVVSFVQIEMLIYNSFALNGKLNLVIFYTNYVLIFLILMSLVIKNGAKHFLMIAFYLCFFIFLMGQKLFKAEKNVFLTFVRTELDTKQFLLFLSILSLGIIFTYYSYMFFCSCVLEKKCRSVLCKRNAKQILPIVRFLFFITLPMALYMQLKVVMVRSALSYTGGYLVNVDIPTIVKIGYYLFTSFSMIYLAMKPKKREVFMIILLLLFMEGGVQLLQGRRALFATTIFFFVWYLLKYFDIKSINMKYVFGFGMGGLLLVILFFFVEMRRGNLGVHNVSLIYIIKKFMTSTGGSDSVIANTIVKKNSFPKAGARYLIDPVINNPIAIILTKKNGINQGINYVNNFNSFSHWISYLTEASLYNSGHGMGSSYLAEIYLAFGYLGIPAIAIILGWVIYCMSKISMEGSVFKLSVVFVLVKNLFTLPRDGLFSWFGEFTYMLVGFCIIYPIYMFYCKRIVRSGDKHE